MTTIVKRPPFCEPANCPFCQRHAWSIGIKRLGRDHWICLECAQVASLLSNVKKPDLTTYEQNAILDAGAKGGEFLDSIGVTDLAALDEAQFVEFIKTVVFRFGDSVREQVEAGAAPF
jgi:Family of unknown function (DUF6511)